MQYSTLHGNLKINEVNVEVNCKLNGKYCGKCCYNTEMVLTEEDIKRIAGLGYPEEYFVDLTGSFPKLRNVNGHCVFLDEETGKCLIYDRRPLGCRLYPLVYDAKEGKVTVDSLCPKAKEISKETIRKYEKIVKMLATRVLRKM